MAESERRKRGGRPRWSGEPRVKFTTMLMPSTVAFLREVGRGQANVGIERLQEAFQDNLKALRNQLAAKRNNRAHPRWKTARD